MRRLRFLLPLAGLALWAACRTDPPVPPGTPVYDPTPVTLEWLDVPLGLPPFPADVLASMTEEGVDLGRHLFFDPRLSGDSTQSCASCHHIGAGTVDGGNPVSVGIDGIAGTRNSMPIFNLAYAKDFEITPEGVPVGGYFWDSRAATLKEQVLLPIQDPIEMHNTLPDAVASLRRSALYREKFFAAFGDSMATAEHTADALTQYLHGILSGNTPFDRYINSVEFWDDDVFDGYTLFSTLEPLGADCIHCHTPGGLFTTFEIRNNALQPHTRYTQFEDPGLGAVTGDTIDYGKFKVPTLRNIALTAPYMHDGRFATLREVLDHYNSGLFETPFADPLMKYSEEGGMQRSEADLDKLEAFLRALTDDSLALRPRYQNPW
jgi:cytochrome c peroxidase